MRRFEYPANLKEGEGVFGKRKVNAERMLQHLPRPILEGMVKLGAALMKEGVLDPLLRELVIVRVGYLSEASYEIYQHKSFARSLGATEELLTSICTASPSGLSAIEEDVIRFTDELVRQARPSDEALAAVRCHFNDPEVLELVAVVSNWMMAARLLETTGVELDEVAIGDRGVPENLRA